jgi:cellulose synthase A
VGGYVAAVSCVTFSMFGEKGSLIISGGNDKLISENVGLLQIS